MRYHLYKLGLLFIIFQASTTRAQSTFSPSGIWRGVFLLQDSIEVPFNFEIAGNTVYFLNAAERFEGGRLVSGPDSLRILMDQFDNEFAFAVRGASLEGVLRKQDGSGVPIRVRAESGKSFRFKEQPGSAAGDISGTYDVVFNSSDSTVGLFTQEGNKLSATILRVTGDSRYLEGMVEGNHFFLSSFIGSSPSFYRGSFLPDGTIKGESVGTVSTKTFQGIQNEEASLPDLYSLTFLKKGYEKFDFSFPDLQTGKMLSLSDEKYRNKVVIVAITGTWCPNCMDETAFLSPWYKKNQSRGVEIISIHYEQKNDTAFARKAIERYRKKFDIRYDGVFGGLADKQFVANSLPSLNSFLSFPTTLFINKRGEVARIHTGYTGPATGKFYTAFVNDFNREVDQLLNE